MSGESSQRPTTEELARAWGVSTDLTPPSVDGYEKPCPFTARQIATRALVLHGVVAVAAGVEAAPVVEWFRDQGLWDAVTPVERAFLANPDGADRRMVAELSWRSEAEWALLWVVGEVEHLGLPTRRCDTQRLVDEIIPGLGCDVEPFLASARVRSPGELLAEDDRHYDLWCRYFQTRREDPGRLPRDLELNVLHQRVHAFEWLHGIEAWDEVGCDA
jgi:hypothetical protein